MTRREALTAALGVPILAAPLLGAVVAPPKPGLAPILGAQYWLGKRPSGESLRGRVVLVDVFTFECINCVRVTPNLKALYRRYARADVEIVAVHTPEVPSYQGRIAYLARQTRDAELPWPIAIDNDYAIWNAYGVTAWPTQLVFDRAGRLRTTIVGDGNDRELDAAVELTLRG